MSTFLENDTISCESAWYDIYTPEQQRSMDEGYYAGKAFKYTNNSENPYTDSELCQYWDEGYSLFIETQYWGDDFHSEAGI